MSIKIEDTPRFLSKFVQKQANSQQDYTKHTIHWNDIANVNVIYKYDM